MSNSPPRPGACFRRSISAPRSTSCNGTSACGPLPRSADSGDICSDATFSSGDAEPRRTSLAVLNLTDEETSGRSSPLKENPASRAGSRLVSVIDHRRIRPERATLNSGRFPSPPGDDGRREKTIEAAIEGDRAVRRPRRELVALLISAQVMEQYRGTPLEQDPSKALDKMSRSLPSFFPIFELDFNLGIIETLH
jgi:hypothetical protein